MLKNSSKNVESDNNKILYETFLNFFYSETVLPFSIRLVHVCVYIYIYIYIYINIFSPIIAQGNIGSSQSFAI